MNMEITKFSFGLLPFIAALAVTPAWADGVVDYDGGRYRLTGTDPATAEVVSCKPDWATSANVIPASVTIDGVEYAVTSVAKNAATNCANVSIPATVSRIAANAFSGNQITGITIDPANTSFRALDGVVYTADMRRAVTSGGGVTAVNIPEGVIEVADSAFYDRFRATSLSLPSTLRKIGQAAFYRLSITSVEIPEGVTEIPANAFAVCNRLSALTLPSSLVSIGDRAFYDCQAVKNLVVPEGVAIIGKQAFDNVYFDALYLPSTLRDVATDAFAAGWPKEITVAMDEPVEITLHIDGQATVKIPAGTREKYEKLWGLSGNLKYEEVDNNSLSVRYLTDGNGSVKLYSGFADWSIVVATPYAGFCLNRAERDGGEAVPFSVRDDGKIRFDNLQKDDVITVYFSSRVTFSAQNGVIKSQKFASATSATVCVEANDGYKFSHVEKNGQPLEGVEPSADGRVSFSDLADGDDIVFFFEKAEPEVVFTTDGRGRVISWSVEGGTAKAIIEAEDGYVYDRLTKEGADCAISLQDGKRLVVPDVKDGDVYVVNFKDFAASAKFRTDGHGSIVATDFDRRDATLTIVPAEGYAYDKVTTDGQDCGIMLTDGDKLTISVENAGETYKVCFVEIAKLANFITNGHGAITNIDPKGSSVKLSVLPDEGYVFSSVTTIGGDDCATIVKGDKVTVDDIRAGETYVVHFENKTTALPEPGVDPAEAEVYDLSGRKVGAAGRGVVIIRSGGRARLAHKR